MNCSTAHFITGDGRGNENIGLTAVHTIFHSEHNRLGGRHRQPHPPAGFLTADEVAAWDAIGPSGWDYGERLFQAARFVTEMEYQHLVFEEFGRKLVPTINPFIGDGINFQSDTDPSISRRVRPRGLPTGPLDADREHSADIPGRDTRTTSLCSRASSTR